MENADVQLEQQTIEFLNAGSKSASALTWAAIETLDVDGKRMARNRIVSFARTDPAYLAFDMMRTKIVRSAHDEKWQSLGITSPTAGCGKSTVALNLALSLAKQHDLRVVLVDLDLRRPRLAKILGHEPGFSTREFLAGACPIEALFVRIGDNLAIGASPDSVPYPAELLQDNRTAQSLSRLRHMLRADIVIYDLPPMLLSDDCLGFLPNVDRAMLVVAAEQSTVAEIDVCERELSEQSKLLGVVLNKCRHKGAQYDNYQS